MPKQKFSNKDRLEAEIRNKLTLSLTVLNAILTGKTVSRKSIRLAINDIEKILKLLDRQS